DRYDEPGILGHGNELYRRDETPFGVVPADQRLERREAVARKIEQRLEVELEFTVGEGMVEVHLDSAPLVGLLVELGGKVAKPAASGGFGGVEREVGVLEQVGRSHAVFGRARNPDADPGPKKMTFDGHRLVELVDQRLRRLAGRLHRLSRQQDAEFVAAGAGEKVAFRDRPQAIGNELEQLVADRMPERVIDDLEVVEAETED